jgi:hypothetical protein
MEERRGKAGGGQVGGSWGTGSLEKTRISEGQVPFNPGTGSFYPSVKNSLVVCRKSGAAGQSLFFLWLFEK